MELSCKVYEDLLLLYGDGLCSEDTKKLVEEHLAGCESCRQYLKKMQLPEEMVQEETAGEEYAQAPSAEKERMRKSFQKIRRRWVLSLLVLPLLLVLSVPVMLIANEIRGEGICFSNIDDILYGRRFFRLIADGEYGKAAGMLDFSGLYRDVYEVFSGELPDGDTEEKREIFLEFYGDVLNMTQEEFVEQEQQRIAAYLQENGPVLLRGYHYDDAYRTDYGWVIEFEVTEGVRHPDKVGREDFSYFFHFVKNAKGLDHISSSIPNAFFLNYGDEGNLVNVGSDDLENLNKLWPMEEELILNGSFYIRGNELSRRLNGLE